MQPYRLNIYALRPCTSNTRICRRPGKRAQITAATAVASVTFPSKRLVKVFTMRFRGNAHPPTPAHNGLLCRGEVGWRAARDLLASHGIQSSSPQA